MIESVSGQPISAELLAVIVAMVDGRPAVLTLGDPPSLPAGPLLPSHRSLQAATRVWVEKQTGRKLGYLEQLYTFADLDRPQVGGERRISVSYLGLTNSQAAKASNFGEWTPWYALFPWEDTRSNQGMRAGEAARECIAAGLGTWAQGSKQRRQRSAISFGLDDRRWNPAAALQRYELLFEAGLVAEAAENCMSEHMPDSLRMVGDHRRIVATGMARLRAKIEYHPVVFELLSDEFTLRELQDCVEALAGREVHTQNFRRVVAAEELVAETGHVVETRGRPARLYRFRRSILQQQETAGTKLPTSRAKS
ncbi:MAG: hypothetical protein FWG47_04800 [Propionibacteriaceae bacterium]|nr:hypothetical protein [Propionibacteriaceae bacterium]